jgi:hypothetical protein
VRSFCLSACVGPGKALYKYVLLWERSFKYKHAHDGTVLVNVKLYHNPHFIHWFRACDQFWWRCVAHYHYRIAKRHKV